MEPPSQTHEYHELVAAIEELRARVAKLEEPEALNPKRTPKTIEEVSLMFAKCGLPEADSLWFWNKMIANGWRNNGKVIRSWQHCVTAWKIAGIFPSQKQVKANGHSIRDLEAIIKAKKEERDDLVRKHYNDSGAFHEWTKEPARQRFIVLKREIINLTAQIGASA